MGYIFCQRVGLQGRLGWVCVYEWADFVCLYKGALFWWLEFDFFYFKLFFIYILDYFNVLILNYKKIYFYIFLNKKYF